MGFACGVQIKVACIFYQPVAAKVGAGSTAEKMNQDMVFDHSAATQNLGFSSRIFQPSGVN
jgi:hypothetical protein